MIVRNDPIFGVHSYALALRSQRMQVLGSNLANADTPGFKARDVDFASQLAGEGGLQLRLAGTNARHLGTSPASEELAEAKYRVPMQPSLDGNTVDAEMDKARFAENSLSYQASLTFVNGRIGTLLTAITGSS